MTSSAQPNRRIASNLLWSSATGLVRHPLAELTAAGRLLTVVSCPEPDRLPATEFYAGLLVTGFPAEYRAAFEQLRRDGRPLPEQLPDIVRPDGILVLFAGLDYATLRLTPQATIRKI